MTARCRPRESGRPGRHGQAGPSAYPLTIDGLIYVASIVPLNPARQQRPHWLAYFASAPPSASGGARRIERPPLTIRPTRRRRALRQAYRADTVGPSPFTTGSLLAMRLDYMVLADYVRQDGGTIHIMGAGIDTVAAVAVPVVQPFGVALRIRFDDADVVGEVHSMTVSFIGPDQRLLDAYAQFATPPRMPGVPVHWPRVAGIALQIPAVPLPSFGDYSCDLDIDDGTITQSFDFRVIPRIMPDQS